MSNDSEIENEKWPAHVQKQWEDWSEKNPKSSFEHIDTEELKRILTEDLTYASNMDVKEYTLYQKWCEVQEKFPTKINNTLWGDEEKVLVDEEQGKYINIAKNEADEIVSKEINPKYVEFENDFNALLQEEREVEYKPFKLEEFYSVESENVYNTFFKLIEAQS